MAIDSIRLLTDSAAQLYRRLSALRPIEGAGGPFDDWAGTSARQLEPIEEQSLRRDYRRLVTIIDEIETLVCSRPRALELVRERAAAPDLPAPAPL